MPCQLPTFNYYNKLISNTLNIIVHGGNSGIVDLFLQKIYTKITESNQSYVAVQLPYKDRGEDKSSGTETLEEIQAVKDVLAQIDTSNYQNVHFIGKSLGGLVLQRFIVQNPEYNNLDTKFTILGYLIGDLDMTNLKVNTHVIQGENDPYGDPKIVQKEVSTLTNSKLDIVKGADHSYRNSDKEPVFQDEAVSFIVL